VAVAVVTHNSAALLTELIDSLPVGMGDLTWQLVVADNQSRDETLAVLRRLAPEVAIVEMGRNAGYAAGINAAVQRADPHEAVLVLNPDVRLGSGCIPALMARLAEPGVGIAVPRLSDANDDLILSMRREPTVLRAIGDALIGAERAGRISALGEVVSDPERYQASTVTDWAEGSTQLVSASCWRACGPWDESFFLFSEETEFDLRARDAGFATVYEPAARAVHLGGDSASSARLWPLLQTNRARLFRRRHRLAPTIAFWLATVVREASRALLGRRANRRALQALLSARQLSRPAGPETLGPA
jgi:GT2 family glycosyltransferase